MGDSTDATVPPSPVTFRLPTSVAQRNFVLASLLFHWGLIVYIVLYGNANNSLHVSAMAWAFGVSVLTFGAYVFGANWETATLLKNSTVTVQK